MEYLELVSIDTPPHREAFSSRSQTDNRSPSWPGLDPRLPRFQVKRSTTELILYTSTASHDKEVRADEVLMVIVRCWLFAGASSDVRKEDKLTLLISLNKRKNREFEYALSSISYVALIRYRKVSQIHKVVQPCSLT